VGRVLDVPPMRAELRSFLTRAADYTLTPLPAMLRLATRAPGLADPPAMRRIYRLAGASAEPHDRTRATRCWRRCATMAARPDAAELAEAAPGPRWSRGWRRWACWPRRTRPRLPYPVLTPATGPR
jgi:primosomal protein N' (replication factor Y) (superfamily II helicase)